MQRPTGVVIIAALYIIGAIFELLAGLGAFIFGAAFLAHFAAAGMPVRGGIAALVSVFGGVLIVFGVLALIVAIGLIGLKNWARVTAMVLAAIGAILFTLGLLHLVAHFAMIRVFFHLVWIAIDVLIIWYLNQTQVKQAFGA